MAHRDGSGDPAGYCPFGENELLEAFAGWAMEYSKFESVGAPKDTVKRFCTLVVRRPGKEVQHFRRIPSARA